MLWNVASKALVLSYDSDHARNVLQARIMPFINDTVIVTSGGDGQVRLGQVADNSNLQTIELGKHNGHVHKLVVEPGSPHMFYSYYGHIFVWKKKDGRVIRIMEGNKCIVNQVEPHPNIPVFASSGLEKDITLWAPVSDNIPPLVHELLHVTKHVNYFFKNNIIIIIVIV
ncbi:putative transcription factor WD40-like family [Helianthus annuus]|nr:putative transcription factor WD40-like family [Helianthus annuus]